MDDPRVLGDQSPSAPISVPNRIYYISDFYKTFTRHAVPKFPDWGNSCPKYSQLGVHGSPL